MLCEEDAFETEFIGRLGDLGEFHRIVERGGLPELHFGDLSGGLISQDRGWCTTTCSTLREVRFSLLEERTDSLGGFRTA